MLLTQIEEVVGPYAPRRKTLSFLCSSEAPHAFGWTRLFAMSYPLYVYIIYCNTVNKQQKDISWPSLPALSVFLANFVQGTEKALKKLEDSLLINISKGFV